jgi:hypothetical protein
MDPTVTRGLREELEEITDLCAGDGIAEQIPKIAELNARFPHSISLWQAVTPGKLETFQFNCYQHSFGLARKESVERIMKNHLHVFPGRAFVQFLLDTRLVEIPREEAQSGDHVIYAVAEIEHAGILRGERVESKWGLGHLWRHGVTEVPLRYGDRVRYFRQLTPEICARAFHEYAAQRGSRV